MARATKADKKPTIRKASTTTSKAKNAGGRGGNSSSTKKKPVLLVLGQLRNTGNERPTRKLLSKLSGYPENSLSTTLLNIKKKHGHVEYDKDSVWLTETGWQEALRKHGDQLNQVMDNDAVHESLRAMHDLKGAKVKIFNLLTDGSAKSFEEIMKSIGCSNAKSFGTYTSALNSAGLTQSIVEGGVKKLELVESECFPFCRP